MPIHPLAFPSLPLFANLYLESTTVTPAQITLVAAACAPAATCPACAQPSTQVHSTYQRHLHDLPWSGVFVQLELHVRRFFCRTATCPRRTFVEQVAGLTRPHAQRTIGLNAALQALGLALGGNAGARLGTRLRFLGSATTILRRIRQVVLATGAAPRVVGIDDWALRKGQRYGTVIVDLERRHILDVLPEYTPEQIAQWLREHPSIEVIARDRATIYTEAIAQGAPQAIQVADRWHLTQNMSTVLQEILARHTTVLRQVAHDLTAQHRQQVPAAAPISPPAVEAVLPGHIVGPAALRQEQFAEVKRLHAQGWSIRHIARTLQINRRTAMRYLAAEHLPRRVLPQTTSSVSPYLEFVRERWAAGVQEGPQLLAELQARGYRGSLASLYRALRPWRTEDGRRQRRTRHGCQHRQDPMVPRVATRSPRQATWLLLRAPEDLSAADAAYAAAVCAQSPTLALAAALAQRFLRMLRERQAEDLDSWLAAAEACTIKELVNFARTLRRDAAAVRAALTTEWSNGQTEGQVNRIKMIKRTMFGRASFDLLRSRVLCAA